MSWKWNGRPNHSIVARPVSNLLATLIQDNGVGGATVKEGISRYVFRGSSLEDLDGLCSRFDRSNASNFCTYLGAIALPSNQTSCSTTSSSSSAESIANDERQIPVADLYLAFLLIEVTRLVLGLKWAHSAQLLASPLARAPFHSLIKLPCSALFLPSLDLQYYLEESLAA
ncbi:hypothetical protein TIFTF001_032959 [Ficus carica]|uniref:Uncharacterized protein n=1 Tax=Ficus carica TaxID=3494 RepID=A0AA88DY64_FICCA|nr:hypothetical protein TIFTF001_032959 [Ficus carica]